MNDINKPQSKSVIRRQERGSSPETAEFRERVRLLLKHAEPDVAYSIQRDLKTMVGMAFYGIPIEKVKLNRNKLEMVKAYVELLINHSDIEFSSKLLSELSKQQNQTIRKAAPRYKNETYSNKTHIWEHVIPCKFIIINIIDMLKNNNITTLDRLLSLYAKAGQRSVTYEKNMLLRKYNTCMPDGWDWNDNDVDPFARHTEFGLSYDEV